MFSATKLNVKDDQEFNIWFVKEIENFPCLYNHTDSNYNNRQKQEETWQFIADKAGVSVSDCKERWKNLRACFTRHLKHQVLEMKTGIKYKRPYYLADSMNFILPFTKLRTQSQEDVKIYNETIKGMNTPDIIYVDEDGDDSRYEYEADMSQSETRYESFDSNEGAQNSVCETKVHNYFELQTEETKCDIIPCKRQRMEEDEEDSDFSFLKSLLPDIKSMNNSQKRKFKIGVLKIVDEILESTDVA